ncbi:MAG: 30S ribosomal protein S2 [Planctomycetota bacterium]
MNKEMARELIGAGVHFGHGVSRWNPKMKPYIFGKRGMIHIINVKETLKGLLIADKLLTNVVSSGKDVLFVGTKRQAKKAVTEVAEKCGMHYVCERWLGGMLTNFRTIRSRLQRLEELEQMEASGKLAEESKKQASRLRREMRKIKTNLDGVRKMTRLPGVVVVVDAKNETIALREAKKLGIATVGIIDTDSNPDTVDVVIPANDDSIKTIEILLSQLAEAIAKGKTMFKSAGTGPAAGVRGRSKRRTLARADESVPAPVPQAVEAAVPAQSDAAKSESAGASAAQADTEVTEKAEGKVEDKSAE